MSFERQIQIYEIQRQRYRDRYRAKTILKRKNEFGGDEVSELLVLQL